MQLYLTKIFKLKLFFSDTKMNSEIIISEIKNNWSQQKCIRTLKLNVLHVIISSEEEFL